MDSLNEITVSYKRNPVEKVKVTSSTDAAKYLRPLYEDIDLRERFYALYLNRQNRIIGHSLISMGGVTGTVVDPKLIFSTALKVLASSIILSHNHPSGNLKPSEEDLKITKKIKDGCALLDMQLFDHVILTEEGYYSFADEGQI